ncbi:MAG: ferredoxin--NADP reductase, partial [Gemmatimonadaceae bacterium]|nr:ferredoxin--NADP reductase [Chitinophagaceae bacterium]
MSQNKTVYIKEIRQETVDCKTFVLSADEPLHYQAGQFLTFIFSKWNGEERRSYSFSSAPIPGEEMAITIKRVTNGEYSRKLIDNYKVGDRLTTIGASGLFILPHADKNIRQLFFLAAGSGITPVFSLIKSALFQYPQFQIVLIYSNRDRSSAIFHDEISLLEKEHRERFRVEWLYSTNYNLTRARLGKWLLAELLREYRNAKDQETLFYLCGPFDYMRMIQIVLAEENFPAENIRREFFESLPVPKKLLPPDTATHGVDIIISGERHPLITGYPKTILRAGLDAGLELPYSCEAGRCGTCVA